MLSFLIERLGTAAAAAALALALAAMAAQVFSRYVLNDSLVWAEELSRYALVWSTMIGAAVAYRRAAHVGLTALAGTLPPPLARVLYRLVHAAVIGFALLLAWQGWSLAMRNFARDQLSPALQIEIAWIHLAMPVGGLLIALAAAAALWRGAAPSQR